MFAAHELSLAVRTRRREIGLSQKALAAMSGLSRATVVQVERGTIKDLSLTRVAGLLDALGLGLTIGRPHPRLPLNASGLMMSLDVAARTASTSYARPLSPTALGNALRSGEIPTEFEPHVGTLLDEAPVSLLAKAVEQVHVESDVPRDKVWDNMRRMAGRFAGTRHLWNVDA